MEIPVTVNEGEYSAFQRNMRYMNQQLGGSLKQPSDEPDTEPYKTFKMSYRPDDSYLGEIRLYRDENIVVFDIDSAGEVYVNESNYKKANALITHQLDESIVYLR